MMWVREEDFKQSSLLQASSYYRIMELGNASEFFIGELLHFTEVKGRCCFGLLTLKILNVLEVTSGI